MNSRDSFAQSVARLLVERGERVVFAESCTAGLIAATLGGIPGISSSLCGSAVTYRPDTKRKWLGVKKETIKKFTTESREVVKEMALGVLRQTPEANWGVAVVGHLGPDAPSEKDGLVYFCVARRTKKGKIKIKEWDEGKTTASTRITRQQYASEIVLTYLHRALERKSKKEQHDSKKST